MKDRDIKMRRTIKASEVRHHDVVEVSGQRIRCDRVKKTKGEVVLICRPPGRRRARRMKLNPRKHVELVRR